MLNRVAIDVPEVDLNTVYNIEATFEQKSSGVEITYGSANITVTDTHTLVVEIPKADAMQLDNKSMQGQVMFTRSDGTPDATEIFMVDVAKLLKEDGYGD